MQRSVKSMKKAKTNNVLFKLRNKNLFSMNKRPIDDLNNNFLASFLSHKTMVASIGTFGYQRY